MEETVYSRSVTKQAMSGRVVDKMQIDRHYKSNELSETHTFIPVNMDKRPAPNMPVDDILKKLLHLHPDKAFKYHDHDSLLENKPEQDLNEDEIKEAWMNYEQDMKGVPTRSIMGQQMPMVNELNANIFNPNYFIPPLDATNSLLQQIYPSAQSTLFSQMDYLNFYLDQSGFRNPAASSSTANAITPGVATPSASYLRNQLNSNIPFPTLANPYFPSITKPVSAATMPKRRQSAAKVIPAAAVAADNSNLNQLASLQKRIYRNHDNPTPQNSSANLLIVPDLEPNVVRKTMSQLPKTSSQGTKIRSNTFTPPKPIQKIQSMQQVQQRVSLGNTNGVQAQRLMVTPNNPVLPGQDLINKTANGNVQKSPNVFRPSVQKSPSQMTKSSGAARTIGNISKTLTAANPASRILKSVGAPQLKPPNKPGNPSQVVRMPTALTVQQRPPVKMLQGNLGLAQRGLSQNKIVMNPQHRLTPEIVPANSKSNPPSTSVSKPVQLSGLASSPISITKLPSGTQKIAPKMPPLATGSISLHQIPKDGISQASPSFSRHFSNIQQKGNLQLSVPQRSSAPGNILKAISSSQPQSISQPMGSSQRINSQAIITPKSSSQVSGIFPRISNVPQKRPAEVRFEFFNEFTEVKTDISFSNIHPEAKSSEPEKTTL